jgi:hypothetical protein
VQRLLERAEEVPSPRLFPKLNVITSSAEIVEQLLAFCDPQEPSGNIATGPERTSLMSMTPEQFLAYKRQRLAEALKKK